MIRPSRFLLLLCEWIAILLLGLAALLASLLVGGCATRSQSPPLPPKIVAPSFSPLGVHKLGFEPCQRVMGEFRYAPGVTNFIGRYDLQVTTNFIDWETIQSPFTNSCIVTTNHAFEFFRVRGEVLK